MDFSFERCDIQHLDDLCAIQDEAFASLEDERLLRRNSREMLASCLEAPHVTIGAFSGGEIAAFGVLYVAGNSGESLGRKLGLEEDEVMRTANLKLFIVRPGYRGHGLQRQLIEILEKEAASVGIARLCSSVSPLNMHSARNFTALGYTLKGSATLYGGLERDIYCKELNS